MNKQWVVDRLMQLPEEISVQEDTVISIQAQVREMETLLQMKQDALYINGTIDGKNAEIRSAQLRQFTQEEFDTVVSFQNKLATAKNRLSRLHNEFKALQAVADLLKEVS